MLKVGTVCNVIIAYVLCTVMAKHSYLRAKLDSRKNVVIAARLAH